MGRRAATEAASAQRVLGSRHMTALLLLLLCAAPDDLSYGTGPLSLEKLDSMPDATLTQGLVASAKANGVTRIQRRGAPSPLWLASDPATDALPGASRPERVALISIIGRRLTGTEVDLLVSLPDGTKSPVTVTWEPAGLVQFEVGAPFKSLVDAGLTAEKVRAQFDVGEFIDVDSKWDAEGYTAVQQALSVLSKDELALVRGCRFVASRQRAVTRPSTRAATR